MNLSAFITQRRANSSPIVSSSAFFWGGYSDIMEREFFVLFGDQKSVLKNA
jgi:hypothetical protein